jgi:hypothetical protein
MKKNFLLLLISLSLFFITFFPFLNIALGGVPLFNIFNLKIEDMVYVSKEKNKDFKINSTTKNFDFIRRCGKKENGHTNLIYSKDRYGFRDSITNNKNYNNTDIIILGDSFGISACINSPYDLTSQLIKKTNNKKILNLSVSGTGPIYQSEMLKRLLKVTNTKFKTLIWIYYEGNDHEDINKNSNKEFDLETEFDLTFIRGFNKFQELQPQKIKLRNDITEQILDEYIVDYQMDKNTFIIKLKLFFSFYFRGFGSLVKYTTKYEPLIQNEKNYENIFKDFNEYLISKDINDRIIYYIPKYTRLSYNNISHPQLTQLNELKNFIKDTAQKYEFKFIDGTDFFLKKDPLDVFHYNLPTHFNEKGYELLAEHLKMNIVNK